MPLLLDALLGALCLVFLAAFAGQTLGDTAEAERLARTAALADELASALALHSPAPAELPAPGQPCLELSLATLQEEGLLSPGFPGTGPFGLRWQALICQPQAKTAESASASGESGDADAAPASGAKAQAWPLALACLVQTPAGGKAASAGTGSQAELNGADGRQGRASPAHAFCRTLAGRLPGAFVLEGASLAQGSDAHFALDLAELGAQGLLASAAGIGLAVEAGGSARRHAGSAPASAFLQREAKASLPEGAAMETALSLGGHSLAEAAALQLVPLAGEDGGRAEQSSGADPKAGTAGGTESAGTGEAGTAPSAMASLEQVCAQPDADGLIAFDAEQGLLVCSQGQPALVHDAGNTLAFAAIGFETPDADTDALCPRGTRAEHFALPAVFEGDDSTPAFVQLQADLDGPCGPSSRYGMADYFCGLAPQGRTLQIWQALARKRVWWDEEDEFQNLFGGFFGEADIPWSRARYDRELCQACRGRGFARRMVATAAEGDSAAGETPQLLHAYRGREDMMPASTVGGVPAGAGLVHFTLCRPR